MYENMKLYMCECASISKDYMSVYVVATDILDAQNMAIDWMRKKRYKYDSHVRKVILIASESEYWADAVLILKNGQ